MSVTVHWITDDFERKVAVIRCIKYNIEHSAGNIAASLTQVFEIGSLTRSMLLLEIMQATSLQSEISVFTRDLAVFVMF